ncbi:hypothetical protein TNCV_3129631 [Trichonephila clavipes]|nr:hypothetical protein TNCV_3129631 [Trichonephila clavipes]
MAIGDGPHNFEPRSCDEDDTGADTPYDSDGEPLLKKCLAARFEHITSNCQFQRDCIIGLKEAGWANRRITRLMG